VHSSQYTLLVDTSNVAGTNTFRVSIKKFVNFACRSGDLIHTGPAGPTALEGQKAHKKLQKNRSSDELAEVKVATSITLNRLTLELSGRVDLLKLPVSNADLPSVGEIKSCYAPPDKQPQSVVDLHWAQLKIYGYCILENLQHETGNVQTLNNETEAGTENKQAGSTSPISASSINLRLIWINLHTDEITVDSRNVAFSELEQFSHKAAETYLCWMQRIAELQRNIRQTAKKLVFPHADFRDGQRKMAASIYVTTRDKKNLLCEAPTGIGKTVSALFPAIKSLGEKHVEAITYLTAKNSGREAANDCIGQMARTGLTLTAITITSKKTTCHCSNGTCDRNADGRCPLTIGFFDRLPLARAELLEKGIISPPDVDSIAHKHQLCPFELTLQMLPWVCLVICDYNYVFDPLVRLTHFTENAGKQLLLIDEAHNLSERARSMYSAQLDRSDIRKAVVECSDHPLMAKEFERVVRAIDRWAKTQESEESASSEVPATISRAVDKCADSLSALTENNVALSEKTIDVAKELYRYRVIADLYGDQHRTITLKHSPNVSPYTASTWRSKGSRKNVEVRLRCLNATHALAQSFKQFSSSTVFSATLRPQQFSRDCLGLPEDTYCLELDSPFPPENQGTILCKWIDTRYHAREKAIEPLVRLAAQVYHCKPGNYQIFFPSYHFMETVHASFRNLHPDIPTIIQRRDADETTRQQFLDSFAKNNATLAFSILGGIYGEGVDYSGDKLIGAIVIGTGLPSLSLEQKLIEQDYSRQGLNGFDYASRYPGMTRVLQTAGRVIRSETDKGVVVLVDQRLNEPFYQKLFPCHWQITRCNDTQHFQQSMMRFWANHSVLSESISTSENTPVEPTQTEPGQ